MANNYTDFSFELAKDLTTEEIKWLNDNADPLKNQGASFIT